MLPSANQVDRRFSQTQERYAAADLETLQAVDDQTARQFDAVALIW